MFSMQQNRFLLLFFSLLFFSSAHAGHTEVYYNKPHNFSIRGPEDWYLEMRDHPSKEAMPIFTNNPDIAAFFSDTDVKNITNGSGSVLNIYLSAPSKQTAMEKLPIVYAKLQKNYPNVIEAPKEIKINNQTWALMSFKGSGSDIVILYLAMFPKVTVLIQGLTTEQRYASDRKLFDEAVFNSSTNGNEADQIMNIISH